MGPLRTDRIENSSLALNCSVEGLHDPAVYVSTRKASKTYFFFNLQSTQTHVVFM